MKSTAPKARCQGLCFGRSLASLPNNLPAIAGQPFDWFANQYSILCAGYGTRFAVVPSHDPPAPMNLTFKATNFPYLHTMRDTTILMKLSLIWLDVARD